MPPETSTVDPGAEWLHRIRNACLLARQVLDLTCARAREGVTTDDLDAVAHRACISRGAYPSPLHYHGYPKSICTSVNEVICHGIPDRRALRNGDIVNIDVTVFYDGVHGDCSRMVCIGEVVPPARNLIEAARTCAEKGIRAARPGQEVREIGRAISAHARQHGFSVVRAYCGHGIGRLFHNGLQIPHNYVQSAQTILRPGMVFTVEPMINAGTWRHVVWDDGWTAVTADGGLSAQVEHTIAITANGAEILTGAASSMGS